MGKLALRTRVVFAATLGALLCLVVASVALSRQRVELSRAAERALRVSESLALTLSALQDAETGQRGFLLSGDETYLSPYQEARSRLETQLDGLADALAGAQSSLLQRLRGLATDKIAELEQTVRLAQSGDRDRALAIVVSGRGKALMDEIRDLVASMRAQCWEEFYAAQARIRTRGGLLLAIVVGAAALLVLLALAGVVSARRDLRLHRLAEEERQRVAEYQRRAVGILGHDVRSPLQAADFAAAGLLARLGPALSPDGADRRLLETVRRAVRRALAIVESLIDLTHLRIGSGIPLREEAGDLREVVSAVVAEANATTPGRVKLSAIGDLHGTFDAVRMGQVASNLVNNALKYGEPDAVVEVGMDGTRPDELLLWVANRGPVIPEQELPTLFDAFTRGADQTGPDRGNLGLGLYIVREIARAHGGSISATSLPAETRFLVRIRRGQSSGPRQPEDRRSA